MKQFFSDTPNKLKAVYLGWLFIHFILLITGNLFKHRSAFYPWNSWGDIAFNSSLYDYSEFLIYTLSPIVIYLIIILWKKSDAR